jgi:MoaA/NifB/PqqE/SkfB family radical SAM enzyme
VTGGGRRLSDAAKKARLVRAFVRGEPVHCTWQLSPRCEAFCHFCDHRSEAVPDELDAPACAAVAEELGRRFSLLVSFTGSEPFLRDDLPAIVAATAARHFPLLVTNGWLVSPARARAVWEAGLEAATVSMEDALPERHDAAAGLPGSHERAVRALETLCGERTRPSQR